MDHARQNGAVGVDLKKEVSGMISFLLCLALLIVGYFVYGKIVDNTFGPDDRETPAVRINDGVDYVVMPQWKLFLVQLLNIAGLGPIFGALQGALWGPVVFLWITFGTIFAGGVHDYFSGMMSERNEGASIAEVTGKYLGPVMQNIMRVFSVVLLIMVGTVFAVGPAGLIVTLCKNNGMSGVLTTTLFWLIIILVYYFIATFISIDAIIGKIYPVFGICLGNQVISMAAGAEIEKLPYGHHGGNEPVMNLLTGKVEITAQNHNYGPVFSTFGPLIPELSGGVSEHPSDLRFWSERRIAPVVQTKEYGRVRLTHVNLNDGTPEGIQFLDIPAFSVQYHPEASPGPTDAHYLFTAFSRLMDGREDYLDIDIAADRLAGWKFGGEVNA